jgi:hypothetical protein
VPFTSIQLDRLVEAYANHCVDSMDTKCLEQFVYDTIVDSMANTGESEILERIELIYGADVLEELVSNVTAFPS